MIENFGDLREEQFFILAAEGNTALFKKTSGIVARSILTGKEEGFTEEVPVRRVRFDRQILKTYLYVS